MVCLGGDMKDKIECIDLEAVLEELGQFGRYQVHVYLYLMGAIIFKALYNFQYIFAAGIVEYRCRVPECDSTPPKFKTDDWGKFALPARGSDCHRLVPIGKECVPASFSNVSTGCNSWVYENDLTIVPEFDLACQEWRRTLVGTVHSAGVFVALPITAWISDSYGRRMALIGTAVAPALFGTLRALCYNYVQYLVLEFLDALVGAGTYSTAFILALEMVGLNRRVIGGNILSCTYALGQMTAAASAWALPYWRLYTLVIYTPSFLFIFYCFFVEESVRWLISKGNKKEAVRIIFKAAAMNKKKLSPKILKMLRDATTPETSSGCTQTEPSVRGVLLPKTPKERSTFYQVIHSKTIVFRMAVCSFWWVTVTMVYYGLSINSVSLAGNQYVNFMMTCLVEIPGYLLSVISLDRFGRKSSIMSAFFLCGISLITLTFVENVKVWMALTLMGKMLISMIFCSIYIYTIELFPTKARHSLMGFCSMTGRIGSMSAPQTPLLMKYMKSLPYLLFGALAGAAGLLMLLTPETLRIKLPDTVEQAEHINVASRTRQKTDILNN